MKNLLIFLNSTEREEEAAVQAAVAGLRPVTVIKLQVGRWMHGALTPGPVWACVYVST